MMQSCHDLTGKHPSVHSKYLWRVECELWEKEEDACAEEWGYDDCRCGVWERWQNGGGTLRTWLVGLWSVCDSARAHPTSSLAAVTWVIRVIRMITSYQLIRWLGRPKHTTSPYSGVPGVVSTVLGRHARHPGSVAHIQPATQQPTSNNHLFKPCSRWRWIRLVIQGGHTRA